MFICLDCGATFHEPDEKVFDRECYGDDPKPVCPACGCHEIAEAVKCDICGDYFDEMDLYDNDEVRFCEDCKNSGRAHLHHPYCAEDWR